MNARTDLFLDKYRELEVLVATVYNLPPSASAVVYLLQRKEFRGVKSDLELCKDVRNLLSHNPKINGRYAVEPSEELIALLERTIERVKNPLLARHIWVPKEKVCYRTMEDAVRPAMLDMIQNAYSHIPILKNGVVAGVFSENILLRYMVDSACSRMDDNMKFSYMDGYLPLQNHETEFFRFVGRDTPVAEIEDIFAAAQKEPKRLGLVFVTHSGQPTEKLLGIISAWDMAGVD